MRVLPAPCLLVALLAVACGRHEGPGEVSEERLPPEVVAARSETQADAARRFTPDAPATQILFGDLHVHTTFSADAFARSLPLLQGEGAHPPADACDFARFCSDLDFWSINDHAEALTPQHWEETKESIRQCNAVAGDPANPDAVAFLGWEWTQVGVEAADHYGHKNVIFRDTADDAVPARPVSALNPQLAAALRQRPPLRQRLLLPLADFRNRRRYFDFGRFQNEVNDVERCPDGVDVRELPDDCAEVAATPGELYEKLSQWGFDSIVIPHGNTWGLYTPPDSSWDKQLTAAEHDPARQTLIEVYSGHGNSEEYRDWRAGQRDPNGAWACPAPTQDYLPCCWQAGEIVRARCGEVPAAECERRVAEARLNYLAAGAAGRMTLPGTPMTEWKDCGQCRDCFNPAFGYRPASSAQYALAITNFDDPAAPRRFRFGFIASSDNHTARPGTGYKEYGRRMMTEATGAKDAVWAARIQPPEPSSPQSQPFTVADLGDRQMFQVLDFERQASFFMTGGLVAVHAAGRSRDAIWDALERREVYGTSGDRILLWFDLLNGPDGPAPMGSEVRMADAPRFRVRAVGALEQRPGCPEWTAEALGEERLDYLCRGECYHPADTRRRIARIEVVRIRPQARPGEPVGDLIDDPWRVVSCPSDSTGCVVELTDEDPSRSAREAIYYARAIEEPSPAVDAAGLRCDYDAAGECIRVHPCYGDYRTPYDDDCLAPNEERAWSSPIFVQPAGAGGE